MSKLKEKIPRKQGRPGEKSFEMKNLSLADYYHWPMKGFSPGERPADWLTIEISELEDEES